VNPCLNQISKEVSDQLCENYTRNQLKFEPYNGIKILNYQTVLEYDRKSYYYSWNDYLRFAENASTYITKSISHNRHQI